MAVLWLVNDNKDERALPKIYFTKYIHVRYENRLFSWAMCMSQIYEMGRYYS